METTPTQKKILSLLPMTFEQLMYELELSRRALYYHLTPMKNSGLIWYVSDGTIERAGEAVKA